MSFIITIVTREGIVMAADSRLTLSFPDPNFKDPANPNNKLLIAVPQSDATQKLFLAGERVGISTCGFASIQNTPISGFIESFILTLSEDISGRLHGREFAIELQELESIGYIKILPPLERFTKDSGGTS